MGSDSPGCSPAASAANLASPTIAIHLHDPLGTESPPMASSLMTPHSPSPGWQSPIRQHRRTPSAPREVKETLDAHSEYMSDDEDGRTHHRINQYTFGDEIGRGSYGAVHIAVDQFGNEFAIKEFSKSRLRKRAQSNILRYGPRRAGGATAAAAAAGPLSPLIPAYQGLAGRSTADARDALSLIRQEVAIMKKLNHPNLVQLIEVLDDPEEDSLYMVMEMCKRGVVMKVGLDEMAEPYSEEMCRYWFRDLILGIEYLHAQGVIHRDIKPDNLLLSEDEVLKVVDFGVSEMFEKPGEMRTARSAGSPAFLPPELCVSHHGDVSGKAADIWAMGVTLYSLRYGRIPFRKAAVLEMYRAINEEAPELPPDERAEFRDLITRILEKDPKRRIDMDRIREHAWVTLNGTDPLLSKEENLAEPVEPPSVLELNRAITRKMNHLICVMKSIQRFKSLLHKNKRTSSPALLSPDPPSATHPVREERRKPEEVASHEQKMNREDIETLLRQRRHFATGHAASRVPALIRAAEANVRFLGIGVGGEDDPAAASAAAVAAAAAGMAIDDDADEDRVVAESPSGVDYSVYDRAYEQAVERIRAAGAAEPGQRKSGSGSGTLCYLNRLVGDKSQFVGVDDVVAAEPSGTATPEAPGDAAEPTVANGTPEGEGEEAEPTTGGV